MNLHLIAVLGPLAAAVLIVLLRRAAPALALLGALASASASLITFRAVHSTVSLVSSLEWLPGLPLRIEVDPLAALLSATVAGVALLVLVYALGYMAGEGDTVRFYAGMSLFVAAMQMLVMAGDWLLFLGSWELIGLASYLLIGHHYEREEVGAAAGRAFLTTRAADIGLYLGVFLLVHESGSTVIGETLGSSGAVATVAGLLLLVAAAGKAAQVPFQGWLAAAMVGPTPVSALLHSATLVAAGVILMLRAFPLMPPGVLLVVGTLGGVTAILAGLTALAQRDLKRLLAASTSSQLGLMLVGLGAGSLAAAAFHLVTHAAMKSTLFLSAGVFQHDRRSTEFQRLRGVGRERRVAYVAFAVAGLALAGLPPLAGFWSKEAVLAAAFESPARWLLFPLALAGSLLTALYVSRALRLLWRLEVAGGREPGSLADDGLVPGHASGEAREHGRVKRVSHMSEGREIRRGRASADLWMGGGLVGLAVAASLLGLLGDPLAEFLGAALPKAPGAIVPGVIVAFLGLAAGWRLSAGRILRRLRSSAETGFRLAGGLGAFTVRPALLLANAVGRADNVILQLTNAVGRYSLVLSDTVDAGSDVVHALVTGTGGRAQAAAAMVSLTDQALHRLVEATAGGAIGTARLVRALGEQGIDTAIAWLARQTREAGRSARSLQSGLVHRYLAVAVGGVTGLLVLLFVEFLVQG